jgi:flagellar basal-body rod protein FlgG
MNQTMMIAASGMMAEQDKIEQVEYDMSQMDVVGYKKSERRFQTLVDGNKRGIGIDLGQKLVNFSTGRIMKSGGPFDMAIMGPGLFKVVDKHGKAYYTRNGEFHRSQEGLLENGDGYHLEGIHIPANMRNVKATQDGRIVGDTDVQKGVELGQVRLAQFAAPELLHQIWLGTYFTPTKDSGQPHMVKPDGDRDKNGQIFFGMIERANVALIPSMMDILAAQRYFEANSKGMQAADEMLRIANNIIR